MLEVTHKVWGKRFQITCLGVLGSGTDPAILGVLCDIFCSKFANFADTGCLEGSDESTFLAHVANLCETGLRVGSSIVLFKSLSGGVSYNPGAFTGMLDGVWSMDSALLFPPIEGVAFLAGEGLAEVLGDDKTGVTGLITALDGDTALSM